jgi:hypothetical protein
MRRAWPVAQPQLYTGMPTSSAPSSSPSCELNSNQVWLRPWSEEGVPQTGVRNSLRAMISWQTAGT